MKRTYKKPYTQAADYSTGLNLAMGAAFNCEFRMTLINNL
jgi:hypothetical protein